MPSAYLVPITIWMLPPLRGFSTCTLTEVRLSPRPGFITATERVWLDRCVTLQRRECLWGPERSCSCHWALRVWVNSYLELEKQQNPNAVPKTLFICHLTNLMSGIWITVHLSPGKQVLSLFLLYRYGNKTLRSWMLIEQGLKLNSNFKTDDLPTVIREKPGHRVTLFRAQRLLQMNALPRIL